MPRRSSSSHSSAAADPIRLVGEASAPEAVVPCFKYPPAVPVGCEVAAAGTGRAPKAADLGRLLIRDDIIEGDLGHAGGASAQEAEGVAYQLEAETARVLGLAGDPWPGDEQQQVVALPFAITSNDDMAPITSPITINYMAPTSCDTASNWKPWTVECHLREDTACYLAHWPDRYGQQKFAVFGMPVRWMGQHQHMGLMERHFADSIWNSWTRLDADTGPQSASITFQSTDTWRSWVIDHTISGKQPLFLDHAWRQWSATAEETREHKMRRLVWCLWYNISEAAKAWDEQQAATRAEAVLASHLDEQQRDDLRERKCFYVHTRSGKRYRVDRGHSGNVKLLDARGSVRTIYCIHHYTADPLPDADHMLSQKLLLEANEEEFLRLANATPVQAGRYAA